MDRSAEASGRQWRVLHCKPRQEKSLARYLYAAGLEYYLPLIPRRNRIRGRVVTSHVPLFTSYVFLNSDRDERALALAPDWVEKLWWGKKVVGLRVRLVPARPALVEALMRNAWMRKAPAALKKKLQ